MSSAEKTFIIYVDNPKHNVVYDQTLSVDGWLVPTNKKGVKAMRAFNGVAYSKIIYGNERRDVADHFPDIEKEFTLKSGYSSTVVYQGFNVLLEADFGDGYVKVYELELEDKTDQNFEKYYNPHLAERMAEHQDTIEVLRGYHYEKKRESSVDHSDLKTKAIAFYLPQFHPITENDKAWGKGFTEWENVTAATPRFVGHNQPMLPADLGFYDLRLEQSIKEQIDLAKQYGIYGFCIYYYWFSGKKILDTPINAILKHKEWDFNFCICWANENWTKRWDGQEDEVIIQQEYSEDDPLMFIKDVEHILLDNRYIHHEGKPVLLVYRPEHTKNPKRYVDVWRRYFKKKHNKDLHIVSVLSFSNTDPTEFGMDAAVRFSPSGLGYAHRDLYDIDTPTVDVGDCLLDKNFNGHIQDYRAATIDNNVISHSYDFTSYPCVVPSWDNDARKKGRGTCFINATPELYERWLSRVASLTTKDRPYVFINAWNEWAEGTVLEPTKQYGHAFLNKTATALEKADKVKDEGSIDEFQKRESKKELAIVVHLYYLDQWPYLRQKLQQLDETTSDIFVVLRQTDTHFADEIVGEFPRAQTVALPNRGRDILPFLVLTRKLRTMGYKAVLKLHTKKSHHRDDGKDWFNDMIEKLIPSDKKRVQSYVDRATAGGALIGPEKHVLSLERYVGSNEGHLQSLLERMYGSGVACKALSAKNDYFFIAGSMFYASMDVLDSLLSLYLDVLDFEPEKGQIDGTMAHAVERLFSVAAQIEGKNIYRTGNRGIKAVTVKSATHKYKYAP